MNTHQPKAYFATLTPALASMLLTKNTHNRPINSATVEKYTHAIKRGEWKLNGEAIKISVSGLVLDGQHRLHAVVAADQAIDVCIIENIEDAAFDTIDIGRPRKASDVLAISGEVNASRLAAASRAVLLLQGKDVRRKVTPSQCLRVVEEIPEIRFWVCRYNSLHTLRKLLPSSCAGIATLFAQRHGTGTIEDFLERVNSGAGLDRNDPALTLRERFIDRGRGKVFDAHLTMAYIIKAMNAHVTGKRISILRMTADEKFPEIA